MGTCRLEKKRAPQFAELGGVKNRGPVGQSLSKKISIRKEKGGGGGGGGGGGVGGGGVHPIMGRKLNDPLKTVPAKNEDSSPM